MLLDWIAEGMRHETQVSKPKDDERRRRKDAFQVFTGGLNCQFPKFDNPSKSIPCIASNKSASSPPSMVIRMRLLTKAIA